MKYLIRKIHKYLSVVVSVQLLLWTISGIYFAFNQIELIRGEQYRQADTISVDLGEINFNISEANNVRFFKRLNLTGFAVGKGNETDYLDFCIY